MPQVPVKITKSFTIKDSLQAGFLFEKSRWEGEEYLPNAQIVAAWLKTQGFKDTGIYEAADWDWRGGKRVDYHYYKVYAVHPADKDLYAWWIPTKETWAAPFDMVKATWFEFVPATATK